MNSAPPNYGRWVPELPCGAHKVKEPIFGSGSEGGVAKRKFCWSGPWKRNFWVSQRLVDDDWADNFIQ